MDEWVFEAVQQGGSTIIIIFILVAENRKTTSKRYCCKYWKLFFCLVTLTQSHEESSLEVFEWVRDLNNSEFLNEIPPQRNAVNLSYGQCY